MIRFLKIYKINEESDDYLVLRELINKFTVQVEMYHANSLETILNFNVK